MTDLIIAIVLILIVGGAVLYIYKAKKNGKKCIGCPDGCCAKKKDGSCSCCEQKQDE